MKTWLPAMRIIVLSLAVAAMSCSRTSAPPVNPLAVSLSISKVVHLPVQFVRPDVDAPDPKKLAFSAGAEDELREGPNALDVMPDGGFVVSDPLQKRLAFFDANGGYLRETPLGFKAGTFRIRADGVPLVQQASSGKWFEFAANASPEIGSPVAADDSVLAGPDRGFVTGSGPKGPEASGFPVILSDQSKRLMSLQKLGTDERGHVFVALELASDTESVVIQKRIRIYSENGTMRSEISDIPADYQVFPNPEFEVKRNGVYQLYSKDSELVVNFWDTLRVQ